MAQQLRATLRAAEKLAARGKLEEAIKHYLRVLRAKPDDTRTLNSVGDLYVRLNQLDEAVEIFSRAAEHFADEGFFLKAIAILKKIIRLDPTRISIYERLADLYHHQGLRNEALSQYQVVADYYSRSRDSAKELSIFERMVELVPGNLSHRVKLAELYGDAGEITAALDQYQVIASYMLEHGKPEEALTVYREALDLCPEDLAFVSEVVVHLKGNGLEEEADRFLSRAIERNPAAAQVKEAAGSIDTGRAEPGEDASAVAGMSVTLPAEDAASAEDDPATVAPDLEVALEEKEEDQRSQETRRRVEDSPEAADDGRDVGAAEMVEDEVAAVDDHEEERDSVPVVVDEFEIDLEALEIAVAEDMAEVTPPDVLDEAISDSHLESAVLNTTAQVDELEEELPVVEALEAEKAADGSEVESPVDDLFDDVEPAAVEIGVGSTDEYGVDEALSEARMLLGYGLNHRSVQLFEQVLAASPGNVDAHQSLIDLRQGEGNFEAVVEAASRARHALGESVPAWAEIERRLQEWGYVVTGEGIDPPPAVESVGETTGADAGSVTAERSEPVWLVGDDGGDASRPEHVEIFGEEEEFFDLAAELEEELRQEEQGVDTDEIFPRLEEQSLEEIVEGLKQGVAETLSEEDFETHYNLGIAYREMGLIDEAIGEFQLAAKSSEFFIDCCSLLGSCFLEKGFPDLAIKWYERGLGAPRISEMESLGLLYELGNLYMVTGEKDVARRAFAEIYGVNSNYRDVVAKLEELRLA
jgi:tetratricopeptide (TPR) repeat protein